MEDDIKQVGKFKAHFKQGLSEDGEIIKLKITFNEELLKAVKQTTIKEYKEFDLWLGIRDDSDEREYTKIKRYAVKRILYSGLYGNYKDCLFIRELIDKGTYTFKIGTIEEAESFKDNFKSNLHALLKNVFSCEFEQEIIFKLGDE